MMMTCLCVCLCLQKSVNKTSSILELDSKFVAQQLTAIDLVSENGKLFSLSPFEAHH